MNTKELLAQYTPLVNQIAGGFMRKLPRNVLKDDIVAAGMVGLWTALQKHDERPESFEWYVRIRIRGSIIDELRAQDWLPRRARARAAAEAVLGPYVSNPCPAVVRFDDVSEFEQNRMLKDASENSEALAVTHQTKEMILESLDTLPERERFIIAQHYFEGVKFKTLADELGVSEPRISQLHSRAMQRLRAQAHLSASL
jgi:RNA polymerase sigma factor for flagellar operon FliA